MKKDNKVRNRINRYLNERGMSQGDLARAMGVTLNTINNWCCNRNHPKLDDFQRIGEILEVDPYKLIKFPQVATKAQ